MIDANDVYVPWTERNICPKCVHVRACAHWSSFKSILLTLLHLENLVNVLACVLSNEANESCSLFPFFLPESRIMRTDSSNKLRRAGSSLATALKDRGSCVIPVQPNRSLPIRPVPPAPTRLATSIVTSRKTPVFKLSSSTRLDQMQSDKSPNVSLTDEIDRFSPKDGGLILRKDHPDYTLPDNIVQVTNWSRLEELVFLPRIKERETEREIEAWSFRYYIFTRILDMRWV